MTELGLPKVVDATWLNNVQRCKFRGYLRHVLNLVPKQKPTGLAFGSAVHEALHVWYSGRKSQEAAELALAQLAASYVCPEEGDRRTPEFASLLLREYFERFANEPFEVLKSEVQFTFPLDGVNYGGRIDALLRWPDGLLYVGEWKTASHLGPKWAQQFSPHTAVTGYMQGTAHVMGEPCYGCLVRGISTDNRPHAGGDKKKVERFLPVLINRTPHEVEMWRVGVLRTCEHWLRLCELAQERGALEAFTQEPWSCNDYSGCEYRKLCVGGLDEGLIEGFYDVEPWEPFQQKEEG